MGWWLPGRQYSRLLLQRQSVGNHLWCPLKANRCSLEWVQQGSGEWRRFHKEVAGVLRLGLSWEAEVFWEHIYVGDTGEYDWKPTVVLSVMGLFSQTVADLVVLAIQLGPKGSDPHCCGAIHLQTSRLCSIITVWKYCVLIHTLCVWRITSSPGLQLHVSL